MFLMFPTSRFPDKDINSIKWIWENIHCGKSGSHFNQERGKNTEYLSLFYQGHIQYQQITNPPKNSEFCKGRKIWKLHDKQLLWRDNRLSANFNFFLGLENFSIVCKQNVKLITSNPSNWPAPAKEITKLWPRLFEVIV